MAEPVEVEDVGVDGEREDDEVEAPEPLEVKYCSVCTMPHEYCEHSAMKKKCYETLEKEDPDLLKKLLDGDVEDSKSKRSGKAQPGKAAKKSVAKEKKIVVTLSSRGKKKFVTSVTGLSTYGHDLKKCAKTFSGRFAASSSVTGDDEVLIQGDVTDDIEDVLVSKFGVDAKTISFVTKK